MPTAHKPLGGPAPARSTPPRWRWRGRSEEQSQTAPPSFASALEHAGVGLLLVDRSGAVRAANRAFAAMTGHPPKTIQSPGWLDDVTHADDADWARQQLEPLLAGTVGNLRQERRLRTSDGRVLVCEMRFWALRDRDDDARHVLSGPGGHRAESPPNGDGPYAVAIVEDVSERRRAERELRRLASDTDPLTGLLNRRRFVEQLGQRVAHAQRYGARGAVLLVDLDDLGRLNAVGGRRAGDDALQGAATLLRSRLRASDAVARLGGDEFGVLLPEGDASRGLEVARAVIDAGRGPGFAGFSVGVAAIDGCRSAEDVLALAGAALQRAKRDGGSRAYTHPARRDA